MTWVTEQLYDAAERGDAQQVSQWVPTLKSNEINHSMNNENHNTALIVAAKLGHIDCVRALLTHPHIDIHIQNKSGYTAVRMAERDGHADVVEILKGYVH